MDIAWLSFRSVIITGAIGVTYWDLFGYISSVYGKSMKPIINPNGDKDMLYLNRIPIKLNLIKRGDVIVLKSPKQYKNVLLKRIIGLPGDVIKTRTYKEEYVLVPPGHCWVEGDNCDFSKDSNLYGVVSMGLFVAKATHIIWPLNRISRIESDLPLNRTLQPLDENYLHADLPADVKNSLKTAKRNTINNYFIDFTPSYPRNLKEN